MRVSIVVGSKEIEEITKYQNEKVDGIKNKLMNFIEKISSESSVQSNAQASLRKYSSCDSTEENKFNPDDLNQNDTQHITVDSTMDLRTTENNRKNLGIVKNLETIPEISTSNIEEGKNNFRASVDE